MERVDRLVRLRPLEARCDAGSVMSCHGGVAWSFRIPLSPPNT